MSPRHRAALKKQLASINARLLSLERERHELKNTIARLRASLQRPAVGGARSRGIVQLTKAKARHQQAKT
jgi:hypothetical protein